MEETKGPGWPESTRRPNTTLDLLSCMLLEEQKRTGLCCPTWEPPHCGYMTIEIFHPSQTDPRFSCWKMLKYDWATLSISPLSQSENFMKSEYTLHVSRRSLTMQSKVCAGGPYTELRDGRKRRHDWGDVSLVNWVFIAWQVATLTPLCHQCP